MLIPNRTIPRRFITLGLLAVAAAALSGCGPGGPLATRLSTDVHRPQRSVVLFICDGLHPGLVERGCREGWLPNIQKRMVENGVRVEHAVCETPSITYPNLTTFATGQTPARHGIWANGWFDRDERLFRHYSYIKFYRHVNSDFSDPTVYELLHPAVTASIQSPLRRGVTQNFANWAVSGVMWFLGDYTAVDKLTATTIERVAAWANRRRAWPTLLTCYFPGVDTIGHIHGPESARYRASIEHFDLQFGRICNWLERERLLETTYIVLVSDHGMAATQPGGHINLLPYVRDVLKRRATDDVRQDQPAETRAAFYNQFDTVVVDKGVRYAAIHLRAGDDWSAAPPSPAEIATLLESPPAGQRLWELPGIDLVAYRRDAHTVILRSPRGRARVETRPGGEPAIRYQPDPDDIFGYRDDPRLAPLLGGEFHSDRTWLAAARDNEFPTAVAQLARVPFSGHSGQVSVFAAPGYSFTDECGGHGGIRRDEVSIPLMFAGPGMPPGTTIPFARAADVVPTILVLAGRPAGERDEFDGVALFPPPATSQPAP